VLGDQGQRVDGAAAAGEDVHRSGAQRGDQPVQVIGVLVDRGLNSSIRPPLRHPRGARGLCAASKPSPGWVLSPIPHYAPGPGLGLRRLIRSAPPRRPPAVPDHAVAAGQVIPVRDEQVSDEVIVLSYAQTESGALLTIVARPGQLNPVDPEGPWYTMPGRPGLRRRGSLMIPFRQFTAPTTRGRATR